MQQWARNAARYRRDADVGGTRPAVINDLAWPIVVSKPAAELRGLVDELAGLAELHFLDRQGSDLAPAGLDNVARPAVSDEDWTVALSAMREVLTRASDARIVLGGRTEGYKGRMPGIAEEALTALGAGQPLFLLGGFGGCARDIAVALKLLPLPASVPTWTGWHEFDQFDGTALRNGLTAAENATLVRTVHVDDHGPRGPIVLEAEVSNGRVESSMRDRVGGWASTQLRTLGGGSPQPPRSQAIVALSMPLQQRRTAPFRSGECWLRWEGARPS